MYQVCGADAACSNQARLLAPATSPFLLAASLTRMHPAGCFCVHLQERQEWTTPVTLADRCAFSLCAGCSSSNAIHLQECR